MKIVTWNINSLKARLERTLAFLERENPDVLCLQELKQEDAFFPHEAIAQRGYVAAVHGQKSYNGVAILSKTPLRDVRISMNDGVDDSHARYITAEVRGITVVCTYFPNGGSPDSPKYPFKLEWMKRLRAVLDRDYKNTQPLALCGDFNVAPTDIDVKNPEQWSDTVLCNQAVRDALNHIRDFGLSDSFRLVRPTDEVYTWWDYRMLGFQKNNGMRIDHVDITEPLKDKLKSVIVDREERKGTGASDHAPVIATFDWS